MRCRTIKPVHGIGENLRRGGPVFPSGGARRFRGFCPECDNRTTGRTVNFPANEFLPYFCRGHVFFSGRALAEWRFPFSSDLLFENPVHDFTRENSATWQNSPAARSSHSGGRRVRPFCCHAKNRPRESSCGTAGKRTFSRLRRKI